MEMAVKTRWLRPERRRRHWLASSIVSALGRMRRPTATTVSAASTSALAPIPAAAAFSRAASALAAARRTARRRGSSPFSGVSSRCAGIKCSGSMPIWLSSASRRGEAEARISSGRLAMQEAPADLFARPSAPLLEAVGDAALGEVVGRHLAEHLVAGEHADTVLAHAAGGMRDDLVLVLQLHPERCIRK